MGDEKQRLEYQNHGKEEACVPHERWLTEWMLHAKPAAKPLANVEELTLNICKRCVASRDIAKHRAVALYDGLQWKSFAQLRRKASATGVEEE
eukprot:4241807-Amphidinium_carterae.1